MAHNICFEAEVTGEKMMLNGFPDNFRMGDDDVLNEFRQKQANFDLEEKRNEINNSRSLFIGALAGLAMAAVVGWFVLAPQYQSGEEEEVPVIRRPQEEVKIPPVEPGSVEISNQEKTVYDIIERKPENPEEAIDVSSENLKLLREESEMVDVETLMRYIRIFSDLSSQIRSSTQKRVLVEIALIKLCRPAMETNLDSVLDRLRVLEQRMDERPVQQVFVQPGATGNAGSTGIGSYGSAEAMAAAPEKAAPEDLQKIVASWKVIVGQTSGIFKQMLQKSIPKYNGQTGEPVLYIEFQDFLGKTYVDNPEAEEELKNIILAQTGKSVELKMVVAKEHNHTNLAQVTVDQALRENIHMDVVVEEDPDDAEE